MTPSPAPPVYGDISLRDPAGRVFEAGQRILRTVWRSGLLDLEAALASPAVQRLIANREIVRTGVLSPAAVEEVVSLHPSAAAFTSAPEVELVLEHERIEFQNFAWEWPPEMLHAAAGLTLAVAESILPGGLELKDATPHNVMFDGSRPVFIDVLSLRRRQQSDALWLPYAQYVRTFLLPLLVWKQLHQPPSELLASRRDGLEPEEVYRWLGPLQRLRSPGLELASLPAWFGHGSAGAHSLPRAHTADPEKAAYVMGRILRRLKRLTARLAPPEGRTSRWSSYAKEVPSYSASDHAVKTEFVRRAVERFRPARVLDVGCNTGQFSRIAAAAGANVVAIDSDPVVVGTLWRNASAARLPILPLVVDLARPTPSLGWRNAESSSFLERARGSFDAVLLLAVLHHIQVGHGIPISEIIRLAAELTRGICIAEYIGPDDPMFQFIARGRDDLYTELSPEVFENYCRAAFEIAEIQPLGDHRRLYLLVRRS